MISKLPQGWQEVELGDILEAISNGTTKTQNQDGKGYLVTRIETIAQAVIDLHRTGFVELESKDVQKFKLNDGDILFSHINSTSHLGKTAIYTKDLGTLIHGMNLLRLSPKRELVYPKFLLYLLKSKPVLAYFQTRCKKSVNQSSLNSSFIKTLKILLPPLPIQKSIVSILEKAEALKKKREEADKLTKEYLQSVFYEMFLKNPKCPRDQIGTGVIKTSNKNPVKEFPAKYFNYIDIASIDNNSKKIVTVNKILGKDAPSRAKQLVKYKDIIISTVRPNLNAIAMVPKELDGEICSTGFCVLRADNKIYVPEYLFFISQNDFFVSNLVNKCRGANYPAVSDKDILKMVVPLPPLPLQQKFASIVEKVEKLKEKQKESKENIDDLFNVLMQKAFKGEL